jgi:hypothetical protein
MDATRVTVEISLDNYLPYQRTFIVRTESAHTSVPEDEARLSGHYVNLGAIDMNKRWAAATGEGDPTVSYPWGDEWSFGIPCVSRSEKERRTAPESVKAHEEDKSPEGIYGLWGNVAEYVVDPTHFPNDTRWMGPSFKRYPTEGIPLCSTK